MTETAKKIGELYQLIDSIEHAMMTTQRRDGRLVTRPMATQPRDDVADLWFVTSIETHKVDELIDNPEVCLGYLDPSSMEWVSVSGRAKLSQDRSLIHRLHQDDWKTWFPDEGGDRDGGPDDPRLALVLVDVHSVVYMKAKHGRVRSLFEVVKGRLSGEQPDLGRVEKIKTVP